MKLIDTLWQGRRRPRPATAMSDHVGAEAKLILCQEENRKLLAFLEVEERGRLNAENLVEDLRRDCETLEGQVETYRDKLAEVERELRAAKRHLLAQLSRLPREREDTP